MLKKSAFSMAELLLVIMIIGIVSALGMTITKQGTDKAYNLYFYNGYINLYNAIADINNRGGNVNAQNIAQRFGADVNNNSFTANNGITYNVNGNADGTTTITMTVPQRKTRSNPGGVARTTLLYTNNELIPIAGGDVDLQNRRYLLPTYIDDGVVGRVIPNNNGTPSFTPIQYRSYREAYCRLNGTDQNVDCTNLQQNTSSGVLKFADPRKAH